MKKLFKKKQKDLDFIGDDLMELETEAPEGKKKFKFKFKFKKRYIAIAVALILVITIGSQAAAPKEMTPEVEVTEAGTGDVQALLDTSGTVQTGEQKTYFAPVNARIDAIPVQAGDTVAAGDLLVQFDQSDLDTQYRTAELTGAASEYGYRDAVGKSGEAASDLGSAKSEKRSLEKKVKSKKSEVSSLQNTVKKKAAEAAASQSSQLNSIHSERSKLNSELLDLSKKAIDLSSNIAKKTEELTLAMNGGADTGKLQAELDELNKKYNDNQKRQLEINARLSEMGVDETSLSSIDVSDYETQLANAQSDLAELQSELAMKESEISMAESSILSGNALGQLQATSNAEELTAMTTMELLGKARAGITADFNGVVTSVTAVSGETALQAGELITVASNDDVRVKISVGKYDLEKIKVGQQAEASIVGTDYKGKVTKIDKMATTTEDGNIVIGAEVTLDKPDDNIYLGVEASVSIEGEKVKNVVTVPTNAVNTDTDGQFCYIVEGGKIKKVTVTTGISSMKYIEIKEGIKKGDQVVTSIPEGIEEGTQVEVVNQEQAK